MLTARRSIVAFVATLALALGIGSSQAPEKPPSIIPASRTDEGSVVRQNETLRRVREATGAVPLVFLGDSITQGWEGSGKDVWASTIAPLAPAVLNLGVGGDRTQHVLWRLEQAPLTKLDAKCIVLMIGTNNLGQGDPATIALGIRTIVETLLTQCPRAMVIVLGIFPRGATMNPMRGDACQINQSLTAFAAQHASRRVTYLDIGSAFIEPDGSIKKEIMPDFLHLSAEGYRRWADTVVPRIKVVLAKP